VRRYNALELRLDKRFSQNYYINASYTFSRLIGNYSGLASSDEAQRSGGVGRNSPNVNRNFDLPFIGFTADGKPDIGRLPTDRPHAFKVATGYTINYGSNRFFGRLFGGGDFAKSNSTELTAFTWRKAARLSHRASALPLSAVRYLKAVVTSVVHTCSRKQTLRFGTGFGSATMNA
jgi:hypothetical protein